ncbi:MAG: folylpolyglutamate synthase/dihydrofolate synthase family protein [Spirochaetota bacterium]
MVRLGGLFGHPETHFKTIHIAGSKGKGSTAAFIASIMESAGFKTGLYTSPHVTSYKERITLAGKELDESLYISLINLIYEKIGGLKTGDLAGDEGPTTFELLTILAFLTFREVGCEWAVIETGIGGRLDATNVIMPEASVLTPVEKEHTDILGVTLDSIALEKAGIIKKSTPVFCGYQYPLVENIFKKTAAARSAPFYLLKEHIKSLNSTLSLEGTAIEISWHDGSSSKGLLLLNGDFQAENAALATLTTRYILSNCALSSAASRTGINAIIEKGLDKTTLPGRMELILKQPPIILDGAHTPVSIGRLVKAFTSLFFIDSILIFGSVIGKDNESMADILAPVFHQIIISTPGTFKKSNVQAVYAAFLRRNPHTILEASPQKALEYAMELSDNIKPILVCGSFYMVAEIRKLLV